MFCPLETMYCSWRSRKTVFDSTEMLSFEVIMKPPIAFQGCVVIYLNSVGSVTPSVV